MLILARAQNTPLFILAILFSRRANVLYLIRAAKARLQVLNWPNYGLLTGYKSKSVCHSKSPLAFRCHKKGKRSKWFQFGSQAHT